MNNIISSAKNHPFIAERPMVRQFIKFGLVGFLNTLIDYILFTAFFYLLDIHYLYANAMSFTIAVTNSYLLNRRWTFRSDNPNWRAEAAKFLTVNIIGLGLSEIILFILVEHFQMYQLLAKAMAIVVVLFWNFTGTRFWAFRKGTLPPPARPLP